MVVLEELQKRLQNIRGSGVYGRLPHRPATGVTASGVEPKWSALFA